jgi:predicted O-methyltransferase YrrM
MKTNNVFDMIRMLVGYSGDFASGFAGKIDLLFIDGNHDYQAVSKDYRDWTPLVEVGGIVAFHDVTFKPAGDDSPGPGMVVKEHVLGKPEWSVMKQVDSLLVARKLR